MCCVLTEVCDPVRVQVGAWMVLAVVGTRALHLRSEVSPAAKVKDVVSLAENYVR